MAIDRRRFLALLAIGAPAMVVEKRLAVLAGLKSYFLAPCGSSRAAESIPESFLPPELDDLLRDPAISDILVNSYNKVYVERAGKLQLTDLSFRDNQHLMQIIDRIVSAVGRRLDESSPMVDAWLSDRLRMNVIIPPLAIDGPCLTIRRFAGDSVMARRWQQIAKHERNG